MLNVFSEIGQLKTVLLHEPGQELENLTPNLLNELLFDDIPWLPLAIKEHRAFADALTKNGVKVVYLVDLVTESLDVNPKYKEMFINQYIEEASIYSETLRNLTYEYLKSIKNTKDLVKKTMTGIRKTDFPNFFKRTLSDFIADYPFVTFPMPNLYFTRDPFAIIGNSVSLNKMFTNTRSRETIYGEYIFKYHPIYKNPNMLYTRYNKTNIEGGDIIVLNDKIVAIGISQRTHPASIERFAKNLFSSGKYEKVLAFDLPKSRTFMHLDTVFTQVDYGKFTIHPHCYDNFKVYELTPNKEVKDKLVVNKLEDRLENILKKYLETDITLIKCGGDDIVSSDREQWSDGANTLAIAPGKIIVYNRNHITNSILEKNGIEVITIPSSELSRGRGGPRCMCMPLWRENLK